MSTYTDAAHAALLKADRPMTVRELFETHDTFESPDQLSKAIGHLVKTGRAECVGMTTPKKGNPRRIYRAITQDEQAERESSAPADLDQQLAEAIRERDTETAEAVIEPLAAVAPMIGEWPNELQYDPDDVALKRPEGLIDAQPPRNGLKIIERQNGDPIINAMRRMQIGKPQIQGIEADIRRARELAAVIGTAGPDVSSWLYELADKLENAA